MTINQRAELDVRPLPPRERHARIFGAFEALPENGVFILVNDHDPKPLLYQFQSERAGQYEWSVLEEGPEVWRVAITRRRTVPPGTRTVSDFLGWDHRRLDRLMEETAQLLAGGRREEAARRFGEFRTGLLRHIQMEEGHLFPAFEKATGIGEGGPTAVMRMEHNQIKVALDRIESFLREPQAAPAALSGLRSALFAVLGPHNEKEEAVVYPMTDGGLPQRDRNDLVLRMQAI